jgi:hypothetical protein
MIVEFHNCYLVKSINRRTYFIVEGIIFFNIQKYCTIVENYLFLRYGPIIYHPPYLFTRTALFIFFLIYIKKKFICLIIVWN